MNQPASVDIAVYEHFEEAGQAHPEAFLDGAGQELFYTSEWFKTLARHGNTFHGQAQIIVARDKSANATVCLPMIDEKKTLKGLSNYYASLFGPIGDQTRATTRICDAIAGWIRAQPRRWPIIDLAPLDTAQPFFPAMRQALDDHGYRTDDYFCFGNWHHDTAGQTFDDYLASRPSELRNTLRRNRRKAEKSGPIRIDIHRQPGEALETAIQQFHAIYRNSWKPEESHPAFIAELCRVAAQRGWLRLGLLTHRQEPIAAQIWLVHGGKANIFKLAYREGKNPFSAGTLLTADLMREVIDVDQVREIDYLTGDDPYKQSWMSSRRERKGLVAFDLRTPHGIVAFLKHRLGKVRKRNADWPVIPAKAGIQ